MSDDDVVTRIVASLRTELTDAQFHEFHRLVKDLRQDNPAQLLEPRDIVAMVGAAMFNLGDITQDEIERINREVFGDGT